MTAEVVNPIPYPADMRRSVPPTVVPSAEPVEPTGGRHAAPEEDDAYGPVFGAGFMDMDPGDTGWWG